MRKLSKKSGKNTGGKTMKGNNGILNSLQDQNYLKNLFQGWFGEQEKIKIYPIKIYKGEKYSHFVFFYHYGQFSVFCSSRSDGRRQKTYHIMKALTPYFEKQKFCLPAPLGYQSETKALFYQAAEGMNLLAAIEKKIDSKQTIQDTALFLKTLHQINPKNLSLDSCPLDRRALDPTDILGNYCPRLPEQCQQAKEFLEKTFQVKNNFTFRNQVISHGDIHPENVIIAENYNGRRTVVVDFTETCLAPPAYDLANFLAQLWIMMTFNNWAEEEIEEYQNVFLKTYLGGEKLDPETEKEIDFFSAWIYLRGAIYYMSTETTDRVAPLLEQAQGKIGQSQNQ